MRLLRPCRRRWDLIDTVRDGLCHRKQRISRNHAHRPWTIWPGGYRSVVSVPAEMAVSIRNGVAWRRHVGFPSGWRPKHRRGAADLGAIASPISCSCQAERVAAREAVAFHVGSSTVPVLNRVPIGNRDARSAYFAAEDVTKRIDADVRQMVPKDSRSVPEQSDHRILF